MTNFAEMNRKELRVACKAAGIQYGSLTVGGMRDTLALVDINTLGAYGFGVDENSAVCPHCGINHFDNGYSFHHAKETPHDKFENACLGCGGEWGPKIEASKTEDRHTGSGLKIEKVRPEQNGVKRPSAGGKCRAVWDALDELQAELEGDEKVTAKMVKDLAADEGWNVNNASIEFYNWRKFNGVSGRSK